MEKLLSIQEASDFIGLKTPTVYKYVCMKKIPYVKLGTRVLFSKDRLEKWVKENSVEPITHIKKVSCLIQKGN